MSLIQAVTAVWPASQWTDVSVLVAVSGGPDSVALLRAICSLKREHGGAGKLVVGHFHHRLREEADGDARFVAELAGRLSLPYEQSEARVGSLAKQRRDGIEAAAREARYSFLQSTAEKWGARYVATGHTLDDQIETVLFNILRGTGLAGVAAMTLARPLGPAVSLVRPILTVRRREVLAYLEEIGQAYRTDSTNACTDFSRNRLRHELLPLLREKFNPDIDSALARLSGLAGDAQRIIEGIADDLLDRCLGGPRAPSATNGSVALSLGPIREVDRHLIRELFIALWRRQSWPLQDMGFAEWNALADMASLASGRQVSAAVKSMFPGGILVERRADGSVSLTPCAP
jgi:tRNA(Ile)-lysidine synthase